MDKSDKLARGKVHRTGNAALCEAGVQELGFLLGQSLNNPEVQRAFGIARSAVKRQVSFDEPGLPNFYCSEGDQLVEAIKNAIDCLQNVEGSRSFMLIRDETVYSKSFNMLYGLSEDMPCVVGGVHPSHSKLFIDENKGITLEKKCWPQ